MFYLFIIINNTFLFYNGRLYSCATDLIIIIIIIIIRKEGNVLFNDALNTFYLRLYGVTYMVKHHSDTERDETRCRHMDYSF